MTGAPESPLDAPGRDAGPASPIFPRPAATERRAAPFTGPTHETTWAGDLALVQRTLGEDRAARNELVERMICIPRFLRRFEQRHGDPLGDTALADLSQEVAARVWRDRSRFTGRSRLESWVFGYAQRVYQEALAAWRARPDTRLGTEETGLDPVDPTAPVEEAVADRMDAQSILDLVDELPAPESEVIRAKLLEGLPFSEIARQRREDLNAVKSRYYRALDRIRERFESLAHRRETRR